jgi:ribonuclease D
LSLAALIRQYLGIEFEKQKKLQRSQWENRPLTAEQIHYAVRDTYYLMPLFEKLHDELEKKGLMEEAGRAFADIAQAVWQEKTFDPRGHRRVSGYDGLKPDEQKILKQLYQWRFKKAMDSNRAAFMILSNEDLISVTKAAAGSPRQLITDGRLSPDKASRYGNEIMEILSQQET